MATRVSDNPVVQTHYEATVGLTTALERTLARLWRTLTPTRTRLADYMTATGAVIDHYAMASASLSADYYEAMRTQAGINGAFTVPMVAAPPAAKVTHYLGEATDLLLHPGPLSVDEATATVEQQVQAVSQKFVADTGRLEVLTAVRDDKQARRWARVTRPGACYFCRLLSLRGATYRTEQTASFEAHTNCHCTVEPVFSAHYEPTAHARADQALYAEVTDGIHGSKAKQAAWRAAVEAQTTR